MRTKKRNKPRRAARAIGRHPRRGTGVVWPSGCEEHYGISAPTRWRWEKAGRLPPRDVFVGGVAIGWKPETLAIAERGTSNAAP